MIKQENFQAIFQASPTPYLILKPDSPRFTIAGANDAYLKATGTAKEDLLNRGLFEAFPENPNDPSAIGIANLRDSLEKVMRTKKPDQLEANRYDIPIRGEDRFEVRYWNPQSIPVLGKDGEVKFILHTAPDITEQVMAEQEAANARYELDRQKQYYRSLFAHNPDAVYSFDLNGRFISVNTAAARLMETTIEELEKASFMPLIVDEDQDRVYNHFMKAAGGEVQRYECTLTTKEGNRRIVKVTNVPIVVGGEIIGVYGIAKNITEQRRRSEEEKKLLRTIIDNLPDSIFVKNRQRKLILANKKLYADLADAEREEEILGTTIYDIYDEKTAKNIDEDDLRVIEEGEAIRDRLETTSDYKGNKLWLLKTKLPLHDAQNNIIGLVGVTRDVTQLKQKEEKLRASLKEKEVLLAEVHHRVKNNLAMVTGMMQLQVFEEGDERLKAKLMNGVRRIKAIAGIHEQLYQCGDLTELDLSENLKTLASNIINTFESYNHIQLETELETIFLNINQAIPLSLITNEVLTSACEAFGGEGEEQSCKIQLKLDRTKETIRLTVTSQNAGLSNSENSSEGSMGLLLIKNLAAQLEANYNYSTNEGEVRFTLQFEKADVKGIGNANL